MLLYLFYVVINYVYSLFWLQTHSPSFLGLYKEIQSTEKIRIQKCKQRGSLWFHYRCNATQNNYSRSKVVKENYRSLILLWTIFIRCNILFTNWCIITSMGEVVICFFGHFSSVDFEQLKKNSKRISWTQL